MTPQEELLAQILESQLPPNKLRELAGAANDRDLSADDDANEEGTINKPIFNAETEDRPSGLCGRLRLRARQDGEGCGRLAHSQKPPTVAMDG